MHPGGSLPVPRTVGTPPRLQVTVPEAQAEQLSLRLEAITRAEALEAATDKALKEDMMEFAAREEKKLQEDAWMYAAPRSQLQQCS